ncbi:MAG TPA: L-threonylcarbamoyladenylate synthase [Candidatus Omnitrophota bacterium]|nr:L-threonylcarbamoyladenylate synthase [Candidatus Omnitrophota bacterium]HPS37332.1 L-threonylcarbamoyladenylate synthase [Candidatus Omnitrophota bacterium]
MPKESVVVKIDSRDPDMNRIHEIAVACHENKIVAFPTETVYGIGGKMSAVGLANRLYELKGRPAHKPFAYHLGDWEMIDRLRVTVTPVFRFMARQFWPGPVTFLVNDDSGEKIGLRFPKNRIACALINTVGEPFVATSANHSGHVSPCTAREVLGQLSGEFDILIDGGKTELAQDSTVVDLVPEVPVIVRKGACAAEVGKAIERVKTGKFPRKRILVVCTGNSCRSPMAEGWLKREIAVHGLHDKIEVLSRGMNAREGLPASAEAEFVMINRQVDISKHRSGLCRKSDLWTADLILAMAPQHAADIAEMLPPAREKTIVLDVADPIGLGMGVYERTILDIEKKLKQHFNRIIKLN